MRCQNLLWNPSPGLHDAVYAHHCQQPHAVRYTKAAAPQQRHHGKLSYDPHQNGHVANAPIAPGAEERRPRGVAHGDAQKGGPSEACDIELGAEVWSSRELSCIISAEIEESTVNVEIQQAQKEEEDHWASDLPPDENGKGHQNDCSHASRDLQQLDVVHGKSGDYQEKSQGPNQQGQAAQHLVLLEDHGPTLRRCGALPHEVAKGWPEHDQDQGSCTAVGRPRSQGGHHWAQKEHAQDLPHIDSQPSVGHEVGAEFCMFFHLL
mmetsp:Transcript_43055/g.93589  ORF Transcript_43055/g.93589 Transcript_43055/m.93589 type:complete len:264 (-) Transcript_43055:579-1370(-)